MDSLYVDAHERNVGARCAKLSQQYASKIRSLPKQPTTDAMIDNKYMKLFDARLIAVFSLGLRMKQFLTYCILCIVYVFQKELQNLDDAGDELILLDDDLPVPYPLQTVYRTLH